MKLLFALLAFCLALQPIKLIAQDSSDEVGDLEAKLREVVPEETDAASLKIIDKHLQILGGLGRIKTIINTISRGTLRESKAELDVTLYRAIPDRLRMETTKSVMGRPDTTIVATNGEDYWRFEPTAEHAQPSEMPKKEVRDFKLEADFYGPLVDWRDKGYVFRYEGEVKSRGRKHYLLRMFFPNGRSLFFYFDAKTLMVTRTGQETIVGKSIVDKDTFYTKYERIDGVWMPTQMEFALEGQVYGSMVLSSIEANRPLDAGLFDIPKVKENWLRKN